MMERAYLPRSILGCHLGHLPSLPRPLSQACHCSSLSWPPPMSVVLTGHPHSGTPRKTQHLPFSTAGVIPAWLRPGAGGESFLAPSQRQGRRREAGKQAGAPCCNSRPCWDLCSTKCLWRGGNANSGGCWDWGGGAWEAVLL